VFRRVGLSESFGVEGNWSHNVRLAPPPTTTNNNSKQQQHHHHHHQIMKFSSAAK
jgi:hypothetical protein